MHRIPACDLIIKLRTKGGEGGGRGILRGAVPKNFPRGYVGKERKVFLCARLGKTHIKNIFFSSRTSKKVAKNKNLTNKQKNTFFHQRKKI